MQESITLGNQPRTSYRQQHNRVNETLAGLFSGPTEPSNPAAHQFWYDTTSGFLKQRNAANNAWLAFVLDEDDMASNSAEYPPSQQSMLAYFGAKVFAMGDSGEASSWINIASAGVVGSSGQERRRFTFTTAAADISKLVIMAIGHQSGQRDIEINTIDATFVDIRQYGTSGNPNNTRQHVIVLEVI